MTRDELNIVAVKEALRITDPHYMLYNVLASLSCAVVAGIVCYWMLTR